VENINLVEEKLKLEEIRTNVNISIKKFQLLSEEIIRAWNAFMNKINIGHVLGLSSVLGVSYLFMKTGINPFSWLLSAGKKLVKTYSKTLVETTATAGLKETAKNVVNETMKKNADTLTQSAAGIIIVSSVIKGAKYFIKDVLPKFK
jgi:hypothetical protein